MNKKSRKQGRGNFFAQRSSKKYRSSKQSKTTSRRRHLKNKKQIQKKIEEEKKILDEAIKTRQEYIRGFKKFSDKFKPDNITSVNLLFEKLGSEDLIVKILNHVNKNLDERLNILLEGLKDINYDVAGLYELDQLILEVEKEQRNQLEKTNMERKALLIKKILDELEMIYELEEVRMEDGYGTFSVIITIEKLFNLTL